MRDGKWPVGTYRVILFAGPMRDSVPECVLRLLGFNDLTTLPAGIFEDIASGSSLRIL